MANNKKQFMAMYDESVQLLKKFKESNDYINKIIGIENDNSVALKIRSQQLQHSSMIHQIDKLLNKLQQSYLDPDTARKIGTIKQQYKIQKDRRQHLIKSLNQEKQIAGKMPHQTSQSQAYIKYTLANTKHEKNPKNPKYLRKSDEDIQSYSTDHTSNRKYQQEVTQYDYEIQRRLIQQKNNALKQAQQTLLNVYQITKQCQQMVNFQGENLEIISDEIFKTKQNTTKAIQQLKQANQLNKKRKRKVITFSIFMVLVIAVILTITFI